MAQWVVLALIAAAGGLAGAAMAEPAKTGDAAPAEAAAPVGDSQRRAVVRFLTDSDFPPFNFFDEEGVLTGFNVDLARALCLEINAACDVRPAPWDELLIGLKRGEADAVIAGHSVTEQALAQVDFTDRYFFMAGRFAARRETKLEAITPEALESRRVGVVKGSAHEAYLKTYFRDSAIVPFESADKAREGLQEERVEFIFDDGVGLAFWLNGSNSRGCCELKGGPFLEPRFFGDGVGIAVPKSDPQLRKLLNAALKRVRESGRLEELVQRYFPFRIY